MKHDHEFRDPIHGFIHVNDDELRVVDSAPFQRLREIHQLALTYLVYPGATHKRFEHSLGVLELTGRMFDVVTVARNVSDDVRNALPEFFVGDKPAYWRRVLRAAALCHDLGHLPFSHAAEDLLPPGADGKPINHERITEAHVLSDAMQTIWRQFDGPLRGENIALIASGSSLLGQERLALGLLSEMITGTAFGADRIDYLLRDSYHAGVGYGRFDHPRLLETLRILPPPSTDPEAASQLQIGVEEGGLRSAEALLLARYFMWDQVYLHRMRRVFDRHLRDFLEAFLQSRYERTTFPDDLEAHLALTDVEVVAAMRLAARNPSSPGHDPARRIIERDPFKWVWSAQPAEYSRNPNIGGQIAQELTTHLNDASVVIHDVQPAKRAVIDFPVRRRNGEIVSASSLSPVLESLPVPSFEAVFVRPDRLTEATSWLNANLAAIRERLPTEED